MGTTTATAMVPPVPNPLLGLALVLDSAAVDPADGEDEVDEPVFVGACPNSVDVE
jgi:hypothetical protein